MHDLELMEVIVDYKCSAIRWIVVIGRIKRWMKIRFGLYIMGMALGLHYIRDR